MKIIENNIKAESSTRRAILCSDFLMTSDSEQLSNLPWLADAIKRPLKKATCLELTRFSSNEKQKEKFSRKEFFKKSSIACDIEATQFFL